MKFRVYGKPQCNYCVKAKFLLDTKGIAYEYVDLLVDHEAMRFVKESGAKSVPQIYDITGEPKLVGGYDELLKLLG